MAYLNNFDANTVESTNDFTPIPAGKYQAMIIASERKRNKANTGSYLELKFQVLDGEYKGRMVWARLSIEHQTPTTAKIALGHLSAICKAVGVLTPRDSVELHNLPLTINVKLKKREDNGEMANDIGCFSPRESSTIVPSVGQTKPVNAPWKR